MFFYILRQLCRSRAKSKAFQIKIYKTKVKPIVLDRSETRALTGYMGEENIKKDTWTSGRAKKWKIRTNRELRKLWV
jgi:hypothetical protein